MQSDYSYNPKYLICKALTRGHRENSTLVCILRPSSFVVKANYLVRMDSLFPLPFLLYPVQPQLLLYSLHADAGGAGFTKKKHYPWAQQEASTTHWIKLFPQTANKGSDMKKLIRSCCDI